MLAEDFLPTLQRRIEDVGRRSLWLATVEKGSTSKWLGPRVSDKVCDLKHVHGLIIIFPTIPHDNKQINEYIYIHYKT